MSTKTKNSTYVLSGLEKKQFFLFFQRNYVSVDDVYPHPGAVIERSQS